MEKMEKIDFCFSYDNKYFSWTFEYNFLEQDVFERFAAACPP